MTGLVEGAVLSGDAGSWWMQQGHRVYVPRPGFRGLDEPSPESGHGKAESGPESRHHGPGLPFAPAPVPSLLIPGLPQTICY